MSKNTLILLIVIVVIFTGWYLYYLNIPKEGETVFPEATGEVDDLVNALLQEIEDEQLLIGSLEGDKDLIFSDSQEVSDFSQSANENEF